MASGGSRGLRRREHLRRSTFGRSPDIHRGRFQVSTETILLRFTPIHIIRSALRAGRRAWKSLSFLAGSGVRICTISTAVLAARRSTRTPRTLSARRSQRLHDGGLRVGVARDPDDADIEPEVSRARSPRRQRRTGRPGARSSCWRGCAARYRGGVRPQGGVLPVRARGIRFFAEPAFRRWLAFTA